MLKVPGVKMKAGTWKPQHGSSPCSQLSQYGNAAAPDFLFENTPFSKHQTLAHVTSAKNLETSTIIDVIIGTITLQEIDESFAPEAGKFVWIYPIYVSEKVVHPNKEFHKLSGRWVWKSVLVLKGDIWNAADIPLFVALHINKNSQWHKIQ